eukprot:gnl/TRDRNA2_/TRDRNA2_146203_c2_seq1.p1 gnl/TRDRNA2_/TRDRNA2_146203_c2~~gnl/TRDRNA2_/TRDRNA2_146203_c2_seq1.p1  ORF type:complete len:303 (-),score=41.97 gnl/TRDRNA2_/TRDRNA2_146203_c2_seq1:59-943(-)
MASLPVLCLMMIVEHFDMGTDTMFPGAAAACSAEITPLWIQSWQAVPVVGSIFATILGRMGFGGFSLALYVTSAYIPQFSGIFSFLVPPFIICAFGMISLWVCFGKFVGLAVILASFAAFIAGQMFFSAYLWEVHCDMNLNNPTKMAVWSGMVLFGDSSEMGDQDDKVARLALTVMTRLFFENMVQLWIQASFFSLSFGHMGFVAKLKNLASLGLGLFVCFLKVGQMLAEVVKRRKDLCKVDEWDCFSVCLGSVMFSMLGAMVVIPCWIVAKLYFAFICESHVWNLTSGCVPVL